MKCWNCRTNFCFLCAAVLMPQKHNLCRGSSYEHSHQVWFHLVQWFQRKRLKCKSIRTTDTKWWQYLTCPSGGIKRGN
jgi:hypothetical protein